MKLMVLVLVGLLKLTYIRAQHSESISGLISDDPTNSMAEDSANSLDHVSKYQNVHSINRLYLFPKNAYNQVLLNTSYGNRSIGFTYMSNYHKNVPRQEQTKDDNLHFRSYIQTTSGAIYYYDEIVRMGRRN